MITSSTSIQTLYCCFRVFFLQTDLLKTDLATLKLKKSENEPWYYQALNTWISEANNYGLIDLQNTENLKTNP